MAKCLKVGDRVKVIAGDHKGEVASIVKVDKQAGKLSLKTSRFGNAMSVRHNIILKVARKLSISELISPTLKRRISNG